MHNCAIVGYSEPFYYVANQSEADKGIVLSNELKKYFNQTAAIDSQETFLKKLARTVEIRLIFLRRPDDDV